ncbi:MAG: hypothetical protein AAF702_07515 [Chloroflexota bacterium]
MVISTLLDVLGLFGLAIILIILSAALAPFETMGWWAGWFGDKIYDEPIPSDGLLRKVDTDSNCYILFLSGVGRTSTLTLSFREKSFLERMARRLPNAVVIDDVFPYSVNNLSLTKQPYFARFWQKALKWKMRGPRFAGNLINMRNIFQVLISADKRYGPMYNQGIAEVLLNGLNRYDFDPNGNTPIFLVASSGAAQIAVGASHYLKGWVNVPLYIVSVGGVFGSEPGLLTADHTFHFYGERDTAVRWSFLDAGRWPFNSGSFWNQARRQGRITTVNLGDFCHTGRGSYLDFKGKLSDGRSPVDVTADTVSEVIQQAVKTSPPAYST